MIIGTAGHIDHGKTSLVKMLTGIDTDRLAEEKARGISIELGFAHLDFDSGNEAGVVDVPGHERFIRQMLAGAHGMDLVLLVVAADDGVMPQTEEHLDILHLLGVSHGIVVMTKIDLVDEARRRAVREEVEILLAETTLESAPVVEVSSTTGTGIAELRAVIQAAAAAFERPVPQGCFRLPIDRSFSIHGHGLVVTGTATAGSVREESILRVLPGSHEARVRSIQVHGNSVTEACVGQRIALNLGGLDKENAPRGAVLCDPELDRVSDRFDAFVEIRPGAKRPLASHVQVRIHQGTAEVLGRIVWFGGLGEVAPKGSGYAQIILREPTAIFGGDRFVVRDETARRTIGGGVVLNPFAGKPERREPSRLPHLAALHRAPDMVARIDALLAMQQAFSVSVGDLAATLNLRADQVRKELRNSSLRGLPDNVHAEAYTTAAKWENLTQQAQAALAAYHVASATQPGMEMESLRSQMAGELSPKVFRVIVEDWERRKLVVRDQSLLRLPEHQVGLTVRDRQLAAAIENILADANLTPPDVKQIAVDLKIEPRRFDEILQQLEREQRIVRVSPDLYYAPAAIDRCRELVREHVARNGQIDAAALRDLLQASRKFSIALLTYFDRIGFTLRIGDIRKLKSKS